MTAMTSRVEPPSEHVGGLWNDEAPDTEPVEPWSAQQVQELLSRQPRLSPWRVVGLQAVVGGVLALVWALFGSAPVQQVSATLWGAAAVVLPHALMAWGLRRQATHASAALASFLFWELVKVGCVVILLGLAVWWVRDLSWPALLVALIACLKVHLWALWWLTRPGQRTN
ncbi:ATP synthase subunit I [Pelomonas sp. HMWF004]|nr:ATP synthase subunit I [Pelomonas sp. HMWF004]